MKNSIYMVRDMVAHTNSDLTVTSSDNAAIRTFGLQLKSFGFDRRLAADLMLVQLGTIDYHDGATYPTIHGLDCPVPLCSGLEALESVENEKGASEDGTDI